MLIKMRTIGLDIKTHFRREWSFAVKLGRKTTQFAVFSFNVFPSKTMRCQKSECRIQICSVYRKRETPEPEWTTSVCQCFGEKLVVFLQVFDVHPYVTNGTSLP